MEEQSYRQNYTLDSVLYYFGEQIVLNDERGIPKRRLWQRETTSEWGTTLMNDLGFNLCVVPWSLVVRLVAYFGVKESHQKKGPWEVRQEWSKQGQDQDQLTLIYRLRKYTVTTQYLQEVQNRRRVVYYAILLIIILGELLGELNYIIVRFLEYDTYITTTWSMYYFPMPVM